MRSRLGFARVAAGENDWFGAPTYAYFPDRGPISTVIYCHGSTGTTVSVLKSVESQLVRDLAEDRVTCVADLGLETWGNDTGTARVQAAVNYARTNFGSVGPVVLVGLSMGFLTATNYAREHPDEVAAIAGVVPAVDIQDVIDVYPAAEPNVDAAYPPDYNDLTHGQTHSPIHMAENGLLPDNLPIKIWSLPSDTLARAVTHYAFQVERPQTEVSDITAPGTFHGAIAVEAVRPELKAWIKEKAHV